MVVTTDSPELEAVEEGFAALLRLHDEAAAELLLVRHARHDPSLPAGEVYNGDPGLGSAGICQAAALARRLESLWVEAIYTSPERRARQTATVISGVLGRPVIVVDDLREIETRFGGGAAAIAGDILARRWNVEPRWDGLPGYQASRHFRHRTIQAVEAILARHTGQRTVIVTHASVINAYLSMLLDIPRDMFVLPQHTSLSVVRSLDDMTSVQTVNDFSHLAAIE